MSAHDPLDYYKRYSSIIDDCTSFEESIRTPLRRAFWYRSHRTTAEKLKEDLAQNGIQAQTSLWYPGGMTAPPGVAPARTLPFLAGQICIQEEAAWTAVKALAPRPGDCVLDLCAAPGGKTAALAEAVGPTGAIVAGEKSLGRLTSLFATIERLGLSNVFVCHGDGAGQRLPNGFFDSVMLDVPCSGDGMMRKFVDSKRGFTPADPGGLPNLQAHLLQRAMRLVKPGGHILYATCTLNPEENEQVLSRVLSGSDCEVVESPLGPFKTAPGLTSWRNVSFLTQCEKAHRVYPHLNDTGGFFLAKIKRSENARVRKDTKGASKENPFAAYTPDHAHLQRFLSSLGLLQETQTMHFWNKSKSERVWMSTKNPLSFENLGLEGMGYPIARRRNSSEFRPSTPLALEYAASRPQYSCSFRSKGHLLDFIDQGETPLADFPELDRECRTPFLSYREFPFGYGLTTSRKTVSLQVPRGQLEILRAALLSLEETAEAKF